VAGRMKMWKEMKYRMKSTRNLGTTEREKEKDKGRKKDEELKETKSENIVKRERREKIKGVNNDEKNGKRMS
jgi:hypothetical protein